MIVIEIILSVSFPPVLLDFHPEMVEQSENHVLISIISTISRFFLKSFVYSTNGIIHVLRTQNFSKHRRFLPPDTPTYLCVSSAWKC